MYTFNEKWYGERRKECTGGVWLDPFGRYIQEIEPAVSTERLGRYRPHGASDREVAINYLWNMALSEALYPSLHCLEVSMRNAIHNAASDHFRDPYWFDKPGLLRKHQPDSLAEARKELLRNKKSETPGRIISELNFGFWTTLLSGTYEVHFWRLKNYAIFKAAFPYLPMRQLTLSDRLHAVHQRYNTIRFLRNKVFHFEPIWDEPNLTRNHVDILEAISWINPRLRETVEHHHRFLKVLNGGRIEVERSLDGWVSVSETE